MNRFPQSRKHHLLYLIGVIVFVSIPLVLAVSTPITAATNGRVTNDLIILYNFNQGANTNKVYDVSSAGSPLDLTISGDTAWLSGGGLALNSSTTIGSSGPATKIIQAVRTSNALTVEAWIVPANNTQNGPARIASISDSLTARNFTLGQGLWGSKPTTVYDARLRTSQSDDNGQPSLTTANGSAEVRLQHVVMSFNPGERTIYVDGVQAGIDSQAGNLGNWDSSYPLFLANEADGSRPWLGELHLVAFYNRALSAAEVAQNYQVGPHPVANSNPTPSVTPAAPTDTPAAPTDTPAAPTNTPVAAVDTPVPGDEATILYVSSSSNITLGGIKFKDEDILAYDSSSGVWSMFIDGSDVGLAGSSRQDIDAFHKLDNGSILFSVLGATNLPDVGKVDDSDIIKFRPTSVGDETAGVFSLYFDGSDVELSAAGEDIDALTVLENGDLLISTLGSWRVGALSGKDEDILHFVPTTIGENTSGSWSLYFDGSAVGLSNSGSEDVWALWSDSYGSDIYLSTKGAVKVSGAAGDGADILRCIPTSLESNTSCNFALDWDGSTHGLAGEAIDGFAIQLSGPGDPAPTNTPAPPAATNTPQPTATNTPGSGGGGSGTEMVVYDWNGLVTTSEKGFPRNRPPLANGDWTQPVNFAEGELHFRVEIRSQPVPQDMRLQFCVWQDNNALENCANKNQVIGEPGNVVTWSDKITEMWMKNKKPIDWTRPRGKDGIAIKNSDNKPVSPFQDWNWNGEDPDEWYPIDWRFIVIVVAEGETFSGWDNYK